MNLLAVQPAYFIDQFIKAYDQAVEIATDVNFNNMDMAEEGDSNGIVNGLKDVKSQEDPSKNIFEHYSTKDLSFLKGSAILLAKH